jgi:hypothetical protein
VRKLKPLGHCANSVNKHGNKMVVKARCNPMDELQRVAGEDILPQHCGCGSLCGNLVLGYPPAPTKYLPLSIHRRSPSRYAICILSSHPLVIIAPNSQSFVVQPPLRPARKISDTKAALVRSLWSTLSFDGNAFQRSSPTIPPSRPILGTFRM